MLDHYLHKYLTIYHRESRESEIQFVYEGVSVIDQHPIKSVFKKLIEQTNNINFKNLFIVLPHWTLLIVWCC